jgi:uncharacterized membrane protein
MMKKVDKLTNVNMSRYISMLSSTFWHWHSSSVCPRRLQLMHDSAKLPHELQFDYEQAYKTWVVSSLLATLCHVSLGLATAQSSFYFQVADLD